LRSTAGSERANGWTEEVKIAGGYNL
jgi:hypothetical protein